MKTILLIEDNAYIRQDTAEILELAGYAVLTAENGKTGVEQALAAPPDLVVCDIMMPVLDGLGVLQIFNQTPRLAGVPFIFLTAKNERADQRRGMDLGADDYLTKPFNEAELLSAIAGRLQRFQQLKADYDLHQPEGLPEFLANARAVGKLEDLSDGRKSHFFAKKQFVYRQDDEATRLFFLKAGKVKTIQTAETGKELISGLYGPGEFFGFLPLLADTAHTDSAVVLEDAELVYIPPADFTQLLHGHPAVSQQFVRLLAGRVSEREQQLASMAYNTVRRRVAEALLHLHAQAGDAGLGPIHLSREDLAAVVGTTPESLIRTLSEFKQDGLVELSPKNVRLLAPEKLRRVRW